jgi:hypothetical protein
MSSNNAKKGYMCEKCCMIGDEHGHKTTIKHIPLYERVCVDDTHRRKKYAFKFSGYVNCPCHGPTKAIPLRDEYKYR